MSELADRMDRESFIARYGGVYEHSPWIAAAVWDDGNVSGDLTVLAGAMATHVEAADEVTQMALLRTHPDLAGKLALRGELTADSTSEQAGAGIDRCSPAEFDEFQRLNDSYTARFGFPFILAVKGYDRTGILEVFRRRVANTPATEFREALDQVHRIARLRLQAMTQETPCPIEGEAGG